MAVKLSDLSKDLKLEEALDQRRKRKLQKRQLGKITNFFIGANISLGAFIAFFAVLEHFQPVQHPLVSERVLIAAISGLTIQTGAIIIAAFKGLFKE